MTEYEALERLEAVVGTAAEKGDTEIVLKVDDMVAVLGYIQHLEAIDLGGTEDAVDYEEYSNVCDQLDASEEQVDLLKERIAELEAMREE